MMEEIDEREASLRARFAAANQGYKKPSPNPSNGADDEFDRRQHASGGFTNGLLKPVLMSSGAFVGGFIPPDFLLDGVLQRGFIYALTGPTGSGKTALGLLLAAKVAQGQPVAGREVAQGRVVILAGENSDDVRMRWLAMAQNMTFDVDEIDVHFIDGVFSIADFQSAVGEQISALGGCSLIIVDTSAAFFEGGEENSNTEMAAHARALRGFTHMAGRPTLLVLCHPTKSANLDNLLPRGGGAFIAEVDGNLTAKGTDLTVELHWAGKLRGADFETIHFELLPATAPRLIDSKGRAIKTIIARDLSRQEAEVRLGNAGKLEDRVLLAMDSLDEPSISAIAIKLEWIGATGEPQKSRVHTIIKGLVADGLVSKDRRNQYRLTTKGEKEALRLTKNAVQGSERYPSTVQTER